MEKKATKLSLRVWVGIIIFGLFGQVAWIVENMYFNVFMYRTVTYDPAAVWAMVAASAIIATVATLVGGIFSDKIGKRKKIMGWGYIIWGFSVMAFALISKENTAKIFGLHMVNDILKIQSITVAFIVIMDCIMSYIGSTSNDASFNAWVTDVTDGSNRGIAEGVLSIMPIVAMAAVFGGLDWMVQDTYINIQTGEVVKNYVIGETTRVPSGNWWLFFVILGSVTTLIGIAGLFLVKDKADLKPNKSISFKDIFYGFKIKVIKENKMLYTVLAAIAIVGIANNAYMSYLITYVETTLGISNYILPVAIIIVLAATMSVVFGAIIDKHDRTKFMIPFIALYILGAVSMFLVSIFVSYSKTPVLMMILLSIVATLLMTGNLVLAAIQSAFVRDLTPTDKVGLFQGVRMFFCVLLPMCVGPGITTFITKTGVNSGTVDPATGEAIYAPSPYMFLAAAVIVLFVLIPAYFIVKSPKEKLRYRCVIPDSELFPNEDIKN